MSNVDTDITKKAPDNDVQDSGSANNGTPAGDADSTAAAGVGNLVVNSQGNIVMIKNKRPLEDICNEALETYLATNQTDITVDNIRGDKVKEIKCVVLGLMAYEVGVENKKHNRSLKAPDELRPNYVAKILEKTGDFKCIKSANSTVRRLIMRQRDGKCEGTYKLQNKDEAHELDTLVMRLNSNADRNYKREVLNTLLTICGCVEPTKDGVHIACRNGVVDLTNMGFTSWRDSNYDAKYGNCYFLAKLQVDYNPIAKDVVIHNDEDGTDWSVEYQINSCLDDEPSRRLIWELYNFMFRGVSGGKTVWLLNSSGQAGGGGGKTTVTTLARNVIGDDNILTASVEELNKEFALYDLPKKIVIMGHESDGSTKKIEKSSVYKNLSRGQAVTCNGKCKQPFNYAFRGQMSFESNGIYQFADTSTAVHRKDLVIHFEKCFDSGSPRDYIIDKYVFREDVLEYVLAKALSLGALSRFSPDCVEAEKENLKEVKEAGSDVFLLMNQIEDTFKMNTVPVSLLYDVYKAWATEENGARYTMKLQNFKKDLMVWCKDAPKWEYVKGSIRMSRSSEKEFVIAEYGYAMKGWQDNPAYGAVDIDSGGRISEEKLAKVYTDGIRRTEEGERLKAEEKDRKKDRETLEYEAFRATWYDVYMDDIIAGTVKPESIPSMDAWKAYGKPGYNVVTKRFEAKELEIAFKGVLIG